jgi:hypothetical protein
MAESDVLNVMMHATQLRSNSHYREASEMLRKSGAEKMASADKHSNEYHAVRLLIGTWDQIAMLAAGFTAAQKKKFFQSQPVGLMWQTLEPAVKAIRSHVGSGYAAAFEALAKQYHQGAGKAGAKASLTSGHPQSILAMFA